jgi:tmRNA-binding protein
MALTKTSWLNDADFCTAYGVSPKIPKTDSRRRRSLLLSRRQIDSISEAHLTRREVSESINCFLDQFERQLLGRYFSGQRRRLT